MSMATPSYEEASRFLTQAGFGGNVDDVEAVRRLGLEGWFLDQLSLPYRDNVSRHAKTDAHVSQAQTALFWEGVVHGEDQLRRRVAYALSDILVVSYLDVKGPGRVFSAYTDGLANNAFTTYYDVLRHATYSPAMGLYLNHLGNRKANPQQGTTPNENYARELMQLFTIGPSPLDAAGRPMPGQVYSAKDVAGLAAIMTGLSWAGKDRFLTGLTGANDPATLAPMDAYPVAHEKGPKRFLGYEVEGRNPITAIDGALHHLVAHENTPRFVGRLLIQKLVTSNPSADYVTRVTRAFESGRYALPSGRKVGTGERSDMTATIGAILFDEEARSDRRLTDPQFGRLRQPTLRQAHIARALRRPFDLSEPPVPTSHLTFTRAGHGFGEQPWAARSVFGYFRPNYALQGSAVAEAGLVTPEGTVQSEAMAANWIRFVWDNAERAPDGVTMPDIQSLRDVAESTEGLTTMLIKLLLHDVGPSPTTERMRQAVSRIGEDGKVTDLERRRRVAVAMLIAATDPAFVVQR